MRDFFQQADKIYFDEVSCPEFNPDSMVDKEFLQLFKTEARLGTSVSDKQIFSNLKLQNNTSEFKNGAVLFFGKKPEAIIDTAIIRCVAYQGTDKRFITDDKPFGGNLHVQFRQSMDWLHSKLNVAYDIEGQGSAPRKEIWEIPETVFKEAIINALSHRDYYDKGGVCMVELFDDRIEISNPGGLVSAIPQAEFGRRSHSRNPLIFGLFARMHLVEQVGSGVARMKQLMTDAGLPLPVFKTAGIFTVILQRPEKSSVKSSVKGSVKIIEMIIENPNITIPEMSNIMGLSVSAVEKQIRKLKQDKKIERFGSKKIGYWIVL
jgi:ATP-dependent DNA helicase RecG